MIDETDIPVEYARGDRLLGVSADKPLCFAERHLRQLMAVRAERSSSEPRPGKNGTTQEGTVLVDEIEGERCTEIDDDRRKTVEPAGGVRFEQTIVAGCGRLAAAVGYGYGKIPADHPHGAGQNRFKILEERRIHRSDNHRNRVSPHRAERSIEAVERNPVIGTDRVPFDTGLFLEKRNGEGRIAAVDC